MEANQQQHQQHQQQQSVSTVMSLGVALDYILDHIDDRQDRNAASLVSKKWCEIEGLTRKHVNIAMCYAISPDRLKLRFPRLESMKLKGKPRSAMFNLIPVDWGGYATPWINEVADGFSLLKEIHLRRMIVTDGDLELLCSTHGHLLQVLKLDTCNGFSTEGLSHVARYCRALRTLSLEESIIDEKNGEWMHELASNNTVLETLNFYSTDLSKISAKDLELLARRCPSLVSVKTSYYDILGLTDFFQAATALEEFCGGSFMLEASRYAGTQFPPRLRSVGLTYMGRNEMLIIFPFAFRLKKLDLLYAMLDADDHGELLQRCPNLVVLEARSVIGDTGLEVVAQNCKMLRRLRIERGAEEEEAELELVSHIGLLSLAQGCPQLEYLALYMYDITNAALEAIGNSCKDLCDFRLVLLERRKRITDLPIDIGVRALLRGCQKLKRFALYLEPGGITDMGLRYIGQYSQNIRWMLLGDVGESDAGLLEFSRGCPNLQKLELRKCCFSERALAFAATQLTSLKYLWVQGYSESASGRDLLAMVRPFWNIEYIRPTYQHVMDEEGRATVVKHHAQIFAYYSLSGQRTDCPESVVPLEKLINYANDSDLKLALTFGVHSEPSVS